MAYHHPELAAGRWQKLSLIEQMANVGSEVGRVLKAQERDGEMAREAFFRALELLDFTIQDSRWQGRRRELTRARELLCQAVIGGERNGTLLAELDQYFLQFAIAARAKSGFGLIGVLIVVAVIALAGGGLYMREVGKRQSLQQIGIEAERRAQELKERILNRDAETQEAACGPAPLAGCGFGATLSCRDGKWECAAGESESQNQGNLDISTWKAYRNEKYGFEVRYPPEFSLGVRSSPESVLDIPQTIVFFADIGRQQDPPFNITIEVFDDFEGLKVDQWFSKFELERLYNRYDLFTTTVVLDGSQAKLYASESATKMGVYAKKDTYIYALKWLSYNPADATKITFDKILSTFKFIK